MFTKKSFIKLFSVGMILLQCNTSVVIKKPELSNFLELKENDSWDLLKDLQKNTPPAQANAISTSTSTGIAKAIDNSVAQVVNAVKSNQSAESNSKEGSLSLAVSSGNTGLTTNAAAENKSNAIGVGVATTVGKATADAEGGSVAVAANKNDNCSANKVVATNESNAASASSSVSGADAGSIANQGSLADSKAIDTVKTISTVKANEKSAAAANTSNESISTTNANAINASQAKTVSESDSTAKTDLTAVQASKAAGNLEVRSAADTVGNAVNGGNALSTAQSTTAGDNTGCAEKGSTVVLNNKSENEAKAESNSKGTLPGVATLPAEPEERPTLQAGGQKFEEKQNICADMIKQEQFERPVLQAGGQTTEEKKDICADMMKEDQRENLTAGRSEAGQGDQGVVEHEREANVEHEQEQEASCSMEEKSSGAALKQAGNVEAEGQRAALDICNLREGSEREEAEFKCRKAPRRCNRLRSRREQRKLRRKALRQARRRGAEQREDVCENIERPSFTASPIIKTVPSVDLEASANKFIVNNANGIKQQSADNLAKIQNLLNTATTC